MLVLVLAGCSSPGSGAQQGEGRAAADAGLEVVDDAGRRVRLERPATRIVSLLPAVTETLIALGAGERLVARTDYDEGLDVEHLPSVGGGLTPSLEVLAALRPNLVVAWEEAAGARLRPRLEELGIAVFAVSTQDTADVFDNIRRLGHLTGRDTAAVALATRIRATLDGVRTSVAGLPERSVLYVVGIEPPMTAGPNSFLAQLVGVAGGRTVFPDLAGHWPQISPEEIVRRAPEVLIVPVGAHEPAALARLHDAAGWRELLATHAPRVQTIPLGVAHRPGPSIAETARLLRDAIHPASPAVSRP